MLIPGLLLIQPYDISSQNNSVLQGSPYLHAFSSRSLIISESMLYDLNNFSSFIRLKISQKMINFKSNILL